MEEAEPIRNWEPHHFQNLPHLTFGVPLKYDGLPGPVYENNAGRIANFIFRMGKQPWMAEKRRYLPPKEGGMGCINLKTYANVQDAPSIRG